MVHCLFFLVQVFLSTRRGTWVINRVSDTGGLPIDIVHTRRVKLFLANKSPPALLGAIVKRYLNQRLDHDLYSLTPQYLPMAQHPMVNDDLGNRIVCGSIKIKTDVRQFTAAGVEFTDGSFEDDIDIVSFQIEYIVCSGQCDPPFNAVSDSFSFYSPVAFCYPNLFLWPLAVIWTLKIADQSLQMTLRFMIMQSILANVSVLQTILSAEIFTETLNHCCDLDPEHNNPIFSLDASAYDNALPC